MFRSASRLPRQFLASATLGGATIGLVGSPNGGSDKPSIYPNSTPDILLVDDPSTLEQQIGFVRRNALFTMQRGRAEVQSWVNKWIGVEHAVETRVKSIISPNEPLTPNLLYVGIATLTGSIIARNRFIGTRLLLPPIFLVVSAHHFLPQTTRNLSDYFGSVEETYFPTLAQKHDVANAHTRMAWERIKEATKDGRASLDTGATKAVDKVQELTGLKIRETLGWTNSEAKEVKQTIKATGPIVQEARDVVEQKVDAVEKRLEKKTGEETKRVV